MDGILEFCIGAVGAILYIFAKVYDLQLAVQASFPRSVSVKRWTKICAHTALGLLVSAFLIDPLIPGVASLTVSLPERMSCPSLREHLRVRVVPIGFMGQAGGDRVVDAGLDMNGSVEVLVHLRFGDTSVLTEVYDETQPTNILLSSTTHISPWVRRRLLNKTIVFPSKGDAHEN